MASLSHLLSLISDSSGVAKDPAVGPCGAYDTKNFVEEDKYTFKELKNSGHWILESDSDLISKTIIDNVKGDQ